VEEINVLTSPFSAEYGASAGSAVNIVTKSSGNQYHGSLAGNFRPSATSANLSGFTPGTATSGNQLTSDELYQPSFTFLSRLIKPAARKIGQPRVNWRSRRGLPAVLSWGASITGETLQTC